MKKLTNYAVVSAAVLTMLVACGGGGGDSTPTAAPTANPFTALAGIYKTGCIVNTSTKSRIDTLTIEAVTGSDKAAVRVQEIEYSDATCTNVSLDATASGDAVALASTKTIAGSGKTGVASVAEFTYTALKLSKGSITASLPAFGTKGKGGYLIEGNKMYILTGGLEADGLPKSFSTTTLTKQ